MHTPNAPAIAPGSSEPFDHMRHRGPEASGDVLRLGVLYADGWRGATAGGSRLPDDPEHVNLMAGGGAGDAYRWDYVLGAPATARRPDDIRGGVAGIRCGAGSGGGGRGDDPRSRHARGELVARGGVEDSWAFGERGDVHRCAQVGRAGIENRTGRTCRT